MSEPTIQIERQGPACILRFNRPAKRNAVSAAMQGEILQAAREAEKDGAMRAVILYGGTEGFSAGADLNEVLALQTEQQTLEYFAGWHTLTLGLEALGKPVIAAIEGYCMTGGLELALACDLRVAAEGASFAITSTRIGTLAGAGGTQRLPRLIGVPRALELLFAADPIDVREAERIGLVNRVAPRGGALAAALQLAELYAARAPLGLKYTKQAVYQGIALPLPEALELEKRLEAKVYQTEDKREGVSAFLEKRKPVFRGR